MRRVFEAVLAVSVLLMLLSGCATFRAEPAAPPDLSQALNKAARSQYQARVHLSSGAVRAGRVTRPVAGPIHIAGEPLNLAVVDSLYVARPRGAQWRPIAAGAGIGAVIGIFSGEFRSLLTDIPADRARWTAGGALAGGLLGLALSATDQPPRWERWWPATSGLR